MRFKHTIDAVTPSAAIATPFLPWANYSSISVNDARCEACLLYTSGESLVLIKTDNHDDFQTYFQQHLDELYAQIDAGNVGDGYTKEMAYDDLFHGIIESIVYPRDKVYSDKSFYNEALEEAERRKSENMKKLYSYQILKSWLL